MKKYYIYLCLFGASFSCDIMDKAPLDMISEDVVWEDQVLVNAYIDGIYSELNNGLLLRDGTITESVDPTSGLSDEGRQARAWHPLFFQWKRGLLNKSGGLLELWNYGTIRNANEFLEKIESSPFPENEKLLMKSKVRFARAIVYFYMVKRYGGIPLITKAQQITQPMEELLVHRNKEIEIYDFIINEMDDIVDVLPKDVSNDQLGYPTRYAALALKSRAALYAASIATWGKVQIDGLVGIPSSEASRFWQASYDASKEIIESNKFKLYNKIPEDKAENFRKLFVDENNEEVIFSRQLTGDKVGSDYDLFMQPYQFCPGWGSSNTAVYLEMVESFENIDGTSGVINENLLTSQPWDLNELFKNKDPRFFATIYFEGTPWRGERVENWGGVVTEDGTKVTTGYYNGIPAQGRSYSTGDGHAGGKISGFNVKKYLDEDLNPINAGKTKIDFIVFRYGEILLNYAEAAFELGKLNEALDAVNQIRERAGIITLNAISRDKIRQERKIELAFEDHRYWDLRRWRIAVDAITRNFRGIYTFYDYATGKFWIEINKDVHQGTPSVFLEEHYYLPITPDRISNNPNLAPENPGYE